MTDKQGQIIGVDLGTTFTAAAYLNRHGTPVTVPNAEGDLTTPSAVLFDTDGTVVVGREAKRACLVCPDRVAICVKRDMGDKVYSRQIAGRNMPPSSLAALILRKIKQDVEQKIGTVSGAIITVPAYFDETRRQATVDAGTIAGLNVVDIINEPTSAALAYAFRSYANETGDDETAEPGGRHASQRALVYDLGGGTFDVTIIHIEGNDIRVLATDGDVRLGGRDWDERIVNHAAELFLNEHNSDPREDPHSYQDLFLAAEEAKKDLSRRETTRFAINHAGNRMTVQLTRQEFEELTSDLLYRTQSRVDRVVRQAKLTWEDIDEVLLVGGSTRMPQVREMLQRITHREPNAGLSVDEVVAHGAAIHGAILRVNPGRAAESAEPQPSTPPQPEDEEDIVEMLPVTSADAPEPPVDAPPLTPLPEPPPAHDQEAPVLLEELGDEPAAAPPAPEEEEPVILLDTDETEEQAAVAEPTEPPGLQDLTAPPAPPPGLAMPPLPPLPQVPPVPELKIIDETTPPQPPVLEDLPQPSSVSAETDGQIPPLGTAPPLPELAPLGESPPAPPGAAPPLPELAPLGESPPAPPGAAPPLPELAPLGESPPAPPGAAPPLPELAPLGESPPVPAPPPPGAAPPLPELTPLPESPPPVTAPPAGGFDNDVIKSLQEVYTVNVNAHSLGVIVCSPRTGEESISVVIGRNTPLPASKRKTYGTVVENQRQVKVRVTEGESSDPAACVTIGECLIAPLPGGLAQGAPISVTFTYDNSGRLHVRAKDETSGLTAKSTIVRPSTMSTQAVDQAQQIISGLTVT